MKYNYTPTLNQDSCAGKYARMERTPRITAAMKSYIREQLRQPGLATNDPSDMHDGPGKLSVEQRSSNSILICLLIYGSRGI